MIIECGSCNSRFRLDESRITGRGARVRCRKCGEPITVMKADAAAPQEPALAPDGLDLRSIVREAMESPAPAPQREAGPEGLPGPRTDLEGAAAGAGAETEGAPPAAGDQARDEPPRPEPPSAAGPTVDFRADEELSFPSPGRDVTPAGAAAPPESDAAARTGAQTAETASAGFMMTTADSLDFLKADYDQGEKKAALDISGSLRIAPAPGSDEGKVAPPLGPSGAPPPPPPPTEPPSQPVEIRGGPETPAAGGGEGAETASARGFAGSAEAASAAAAAEAVKAAAAPPRGTVAAPPSFPPPRAAAEPVRPPEVRRKPVGKKPALKRRQSSQLVRPSVVLLLLLFVVLAGGGAYLGFTPEGQTILRGLVPQIESLLPGGGKSVSRYTVGGLVGYYEGSAAAGPMFVIKGQVTNEGGMRKAGVRVHATLLDAGNAKIAEKTAYAGNVLAMDVLRKAARAKIEEAMANPVGGGLANIDIPPGKSVPFMVVFFDPPNGVDSYRLEPRDVD